MAKKKRDNSRGQRKGAQHQAPPKAAPANAAPVAAPAQIKSQVQPTRSNASAGQNSQNQAVDIGQRVSRHVLMDSIFTFVIAASAVVSAIVGYVQWGAMREQNGDTRAQAELAREATEQTDKTLALMRQEQRPWLGFGKPIMEPIQVDKMPAYRLVIKNSGQTPAWIESAATRMLIDRREYEGHDLDLAASDFRDWSALQHHETVIPPNDGIEMPATFPEENRFEVSTEGLRKLTDGEVRFFVLSYITYRDSAGELHWSLCCYLYNTDPPELRVHNKYNDMDRGDGKQWEPPPLTPAPPGYVPAKE